MDTHHIPTTVYNNLILMAKYRNIVLDTEKLSRDSVIQKLNHYEYVIITGKRSETDQRGKALVNIVLIAPKSKYATRLGDFKKILKTIKANTAMEIIIVSENELTVYIKKEIINFRAIRPDIQIESYTFEIFMFELPKHESVPKHTIVSEEEVEEFCHLRCTRRQYFPKILQSDPQAVWLGLKPGMCVRVDRLSETAGTAVAYRFCIKG